MADEIIKVLDDLADRFGIAIDWTQENVMPYVLDLMDRVILYNVIVYTLWLVLIAILWFILYNLHKLDKRKLDVKTANRVKARDSGYGETLFYNFYIGHSVDREYYLKSWEINMLFYSILFILIFITAIIIAIVVPQILNWIIIPELKVIDYITSLGL